MESYLFQFYCLPIFFPVICYHSIFVGHIFWHSGGFAKKMLLRQAAHFAVILTRSRLHYSPVGQIWYLTNLSSSRKEGLNLFFPFDCHGDHRRDTWYLESVVIIFYFQFSILSGRDRRTRIQHLDGRRTEPAKPLVLSALRCSPRSISDSCNTWSASSLFFVFVRPTWPRKMPLRCPRMYFKQHVCHVIFRIKGIYILGDRFTSTLRLGDRVLVKPEINRHARGGVALSVHLPGSPDTVVGRMEAFTIWSSRTLHFPGRVSTYQLVGCLI